MAAGLLIDNGNAIKQFGRGIMFSLPNGRKWRVNQPAFQGATGKGVTPRTKETNKTIDRISGLNG